MGGVGFFSIYFCSWGTFFVVKKKKKKATDTRKPNFLFTPDSSWNSRWSMVTSFQVLFFVRTLLYLFIYLLFLPSINTVYDMNGLFKLSEIPSCILLYSLSFCRPTWDSFTYYLLTPLLSEKMRQKRGRSLSTSSRRSFLWGRALSRRALIAGHSTKQLMQWDKKGEGQWKYK